jgi:bacterial/archaeal transporter family protein
MRSALAAWQFWALLAAVFAALTAIFAKIGVAGIGSDFATFIRTLVILVIVTGILVISGELQPFGSVSAKTYLFLVLSGCATGLSWLCYFRALKLGPASRVAPIDKLSVVMVAIFGVLLLGERLDAKGWVGVVLIAAGALLLAIK